MKNLLNILPLMLVVLMAAGAEGKDPSGVPKGHAETYGQWRARVSQGHARDNSRLLYQYGRTSQAVPKTIVKEHANAIRKNVVDAQKSYAGISEEARKDKEVQKSLQAIEKFHKEVLAMCDTLDKQAADGGEDTVAISQCCADIHKKLGAAIDEHDKLYKKLGGKPLEKIEE